MSTLENNNQQDVHPNPIQSTYPDNGNNNVGVDQEMQEQQGQHPSVPTTYDYDRVSDQPAQPAPMPVGGQYDAGYNELVRPPRGSEGDQFLATVKKNLQLKLRDPFSLFLEIFVPVLFILGIVGIWAAIPSEDEPGKNMLNASEPVYTTPFSYSDVCINANPQAPRLISTKFEDCRFGSDSPTLGFSCIDLMDNNLCVRDAFKVVEFDEDWEQPRGTPDLDQMIILMALGKSILPKKSRDEGIWTTGNALGRYGKIHLAGPTDQLDQFRAYLNQTSDLWPFVAGLDFADGKAANQYTHVKEREGQTWGIVEFDAVTTDRLDATLHFNRTGLPSTIEVQDRFVTGGLGLKWYKLYIASGFMTWQRVVNEFYFNTTGRVTPASPDTTPMPYVGYTEQIFLQVSGWMISVLLVFSFMYPVSQQTKRLVEEKEKRIREAMLIMGLGSGSFYASHWLCYHFIYFVTALLCSIILNVTFFDKTQFPIIFFLFYFFVMSCISLSSLLSALFSKSRLAAMLSPVIFFIIAIPSFSIPQDASRQTYANMALLSPSAFAIGLSLIAQYEQSTGMQTKGFFSKEDTYNMWSVYQALIFDTIVYFLLALWFDAILPSEWGTREHPCFCYIRCADLFRRAKPIEGRFNDGKDPKGKYEPYPMGKPAVQMQGLRKEFTRGKEHFVAVNDLSLNLYEGQVSVILGHNGAGKTTAINLMCGMLQPDAGDCYVYEKSVVKQLSDVRQEIGYCPQHNILWEDMTCRQHLEYFGKIKGATGEQLEANVLKMIRAVDLEDKLDQPAGSLSGGMKRKLSVAIAFVGNARVVFLDEPTAGMDVAARRHTWQLIKDMSPGRCIVLTTHYMDEADNLGNSISIMSKGRLKCRGSPLFLKSQLGVGYTLNCHVESDANMDAITSTVTGAVQDSKVLSNVSGEVAFALPMEEVPKFPAMLATLESTMQKIGVKSFGISMTTLEEIFLRIGHDEEQQEAQEAQDAQECDDNRSNSPVPDADKKDDCETEVTVVDEDAWCKNQTQDAGFGRQFAAMMGKRFANAKRDTRTQVFQVWLPIACLLFAMLLTLIKGPGTPTLELSPDMYKTEVEVPFADCNANFTTLGRQELWMENVQKTEDFNTANATQFSLDLQRTFKEHDPDYLRMTALFCGETSGTPYVLHNASNGRHALPEGVQQYYRTHLKSVYGTNLQSTIKSKPLKLSAREKAQADGQAILQIGMFIMMPFTFIPSTFVSFIVKERECKAKHAQMIAGMSTLVYWMANFLFDIVSSLITNFLAIIIFLIFSRNEYIGGAEEFFATFVLLLFYGLAGICGAYLCSFAFDNHGTAQNIVMLVNFIAGFLLVIAIYILQQFDATKDVGEVLPFFTRIVPSYALGEGIINLAERDLIGTFGEKPGAFDMDVLGWNLLYMGLEIPLFLGLTLLLDRPSTISADFKPDVIPPPIEDEDVDVRQEREEVEGGQRENDLVLVKNMRKNYGSKTAVKNMSFGVKTGEVFGFLGTNGAGKTSTMSILCGEQLPTNGHGYVCGFDVVKDAVKARQVIGYCPQFDATMDLLNAEEHLQLYAGLRGIEPSAVEDVINSLIAKTGLAPHRKTLAMNMSGGNRRKLSVAISLIGAPKVVVLDEPSAGMDPLARRGLWDVIQAVASKCAVILTTHHLEEVEALSHRVAIMVAGSLRCIGSLQQLKHKFGSGYEMSIRIEAENRMFDVRKFVSQHFPGTYEAEYRQQKFTFALPSDSRLSECFRMLQENKDVLGITDYSVSQTSLEQVFLKIEQEADEAAASALEQSWHDRDPQSPQIEQDLRASYSQLHMSQRWEQQ